MSRVRSEPKNTFKASDFIAAFLVRAGISHVFEVSGGMIAHLLDSFERCPGLSLVSVRHEQSGAFAAEGMARWAGKPAVALGTAGPGAVNLLTGIASCWCDSIPAIFIAGQVQTYYERGSRSLRQFGLQEADVAAMAASVTKAVYKVRRVVDLPETLAAHAGSATERV